MKCLPRSLRTLGRSVGTRKKSSIARQSLKDSTIRDRILHYLANDLQHELTHICRKQSPSVFCMSLAGKVCAFIIHWHHLVYWYLFCVVCYVILVTYMILFLLYTSRFGEFHMGKVV